MKWWEIVLEILKYVLPALVVLLAAYLLLKRMLDAQLQMRAMKYKQQTTESTMSLKMQAYERIALFCERVSLPQLLFRIRGEGLSAEQHRASLLMAIQQEYEHNFSQQIYVSPSLWKIVETTKEKMVELVNVIGADAPAGTDGGQRRRHYLTQYEQRGVDPTRLALEAVKKEVALYL